MASNESVAPLEEGGKLTKQCCDCKKVLSTEKFSKNSDAPDGLEYYCKNCVKTRRKTRIAKYGVSVPYAEISEKICSKCKRVKSVDEFYRCPSSLDGRRSSCIDCVLKANRQSPAQKHRKYQNPRRANYKSMFETQNGLCAICGQPQTVVNQWGTKSLHVDHCHVTGQVRGLLCCNCNIGLGYFKDNPELMRNAAEYVEYHRSLISSLEAQPPC